MSTTFTQSFCQKNMLGGDDGSQYCDVNNPDVIASCTGNSACNNENIQHDTNTVTAFPQACALHETDSGDNTGCISGNWKFCNYDWGPGSLASAWLCTEVDVFQCPSFTPIDKSASDQLNATAVEFPQSSLNDIAGCKGLAYSPYTGASMGQYAPTVCTYDLTQFNPVTANEWLNAGWDDENTQYGGCPACDGDACKNTASTTIFPYVCSRTASSMGLADFCPTNSPHYKEGAQMEDCSVMVLQNDPNNFGTICRQWCNLDNNSSFNGANCDLAVNSYCEAHPDNDDCACINALQIPQVEKINDEPGNRDIPYQCWWIPCKTPPNNPYLQSTNDATAKFSCPSEQQVCNVIYNIIDNEDSNITLQDISNAIDCEAIESSAGMTLGRTVVLIVIIIFGGLIVLAVLGFVLYEIFKKPSGDKDTKTMTGTNGTNTNGNGTNTNGNVTNTPTQ